MSNALAEILAKEMAGAALKRLAILHERFDGVGGDGAGEFFGVGLGAFDHRQRQKILRKIGIHIEHAKGFFAGLIGGFVGGYGLPARGIQRCGGTGACAVPIA